MTKRHFTDLTAIDCPFGELDDDTQARLKAWPHGVRMAVNQNDRFDDWADPAWADDLIYRAMPAPVKEVGTLAEIGAQVGDVVELFENGINPSSGVGETGTVYIMNGSLFTRGQMSRCDDCGHKFRIIRRASDAKQSCATIEEIKTDIKSGRTYRITCQSFAEKPEPAGPVITETVKRIVPGLYGQIRVYEETCEPGHVCLGSKSVAYHWTAPELRAAIATLTEIADALEGGAK